MTHTYDMIGYAKQLKNDLKEFNGVDVTLDEIIKEHDLKPNELYVTNNELVLLEVLENEKGAIKMEKYNYKEVMRNDVLEAIKEYMAWEDVKVEDLDIDTLKDYLWTDDSVTGNGSGSYTMNSAKAKEYVLDNEDLQIETIKELGLDSEDIAKHLYDWEYWDVSIRCYLLYEVLQDVLEELQA